MRFERVCSLKSPIVNFCFVTFQELFRKLRSRLIFVLGQNWSDLNKIKNDVNKLEKERLQGILFEHPFLFLVHSFFFAATAFSLSTSTSTVPTYGKPSVFVTITNRQIGILDESDLAGLNDFTSGKGKDDSDQDVGEGRLVNNNKNNFGIIRFITGTTTIDGVDRRVIGVIISLSHWLQFRIKFRIWMQSRLL